MNQIHRLLPLLLLLATAALHAQPDRPIVNPTRRVQDRVPDNLRISRDLRFALPPQTLPTHRTVAGMRAFWHPKGNYLLTAFPNRIVNILDTADNLPVPGVPLGWSQDGSRLAWLGGGDSLIVAPLRTVEHTIGTPVAMRPSAKPFLLSFSGATLWNARTIALSPDGRQLAAGDAVGVLRLFNTETGAELMQFVGRRTILSSQPGTEVIDLAWSRDGSRLVALIRFRGPQNSSTDSLFHFDGATREVLAASRESGVRSIAISPADRNRVALTGRDAGLNRERVTILDRGAGTRTEFMHDNTITTTEWRNDGSQLITVERMLAQVGAPCNLRFRIDRVRPAQTVRSLEECREARWDPAAGRYAVRECPGAAGAATTRITVRSGESHATTFTITQGNTPDIASMAWRPDGTGMLAVENDRRIHVWSVPAP